MADFLLMQLLILTMLSLILYIFANHNLIRMFSDRRHEIAVCPKRSTPQLIFYLWNSRKYLPGPLCSYLLLRSLLGFSGSYLEERRIFFGDKPLGRPPKRSAENSEKLKQYKDQRRRYSFEQIPIEGKFGQGKNGYRRNYIRARLQKTSEARINMPLSGYEPDSSAERTL